MRDASAAVAAWVLTVALHAGVLGLVAALLGRLLPRASDAAREVLWRTALLGGFLTASVQCFAAIDPLAGSLRALAVPLPEPAAGTPAGAEAGGAAVLASLAAGEALPWRAWAIGAWLVLAGAGLAHLAFLYATLRRSLAPRIPAPVLHEKALDLVVALRLRRLPRITTSPHACTPLALGIARPEICVPERALAELNEVEQRAMLAHELAHVARRDPAWTLVYAIACRVLFWHPVPWLARRRLLALAELRCDAMARATHPAAGVALARALVRAAEWLARAPRVVRVAHGHAMAASRSGLRHRVHLLLAPSARCTRAGSVLVRAGAVLLCSGAPFVLPDVRTRPTPPATTATAPALALPAPLATLVGDIAALRAEIDAVRDLVARSDLAKDIALGRLLHDIDVRLLRLEARCARAVDAFRSLSLPADLR